MGSKKMRHLASKNGVNWKFEEAEHVYCFEPDRNKAHVLYDAQIIKRSVGIDSLKRSWPEYHVHFTRWSSTWDRIVPECFLLLKCPENEELKAAIRTVISTNAHASKTILRERNDLLEKLLSQCLPMPPLYCGYNSYPFGPEKLARRPLICNLQSVHSFMAEHFPDIENRIESQDINASLASASSPILCKIMQPLYDKIGSVTSPKSTPDKMFREKHYLKHPVSELSKDDRLSSSIDSVQLTVGGNTVIFNLPSPLKKLLDLDWVYVFRDHHVHSLPAKPSIIEILSKFCSESDDYLDLSKSLSVILFSDQPVLVKSVMDSVSALFDVVCSDLLLYLDKNCNEATQYSHFNFNSSLVNRKVKCPSEIYGAWHLLRFFVRLPDFLARLPSLNGECADTYYLDVIVEVCNSLLKFISDKRNEFFSKTGYVISGDKRSSVNSTSLLRRSINRKRKMLY